MLEFVIFFVIAAGLLFAVASLVGKFIKTGRGPESNVRSQSVPTHSYDWHVSLTDPVYDSGEYETIHHRLTHGLWWTLMPGSKYWVASRDNQD